jgi:molecular chaperone DnaK (HSP70)
VLSVYDVAKKAALPLELVDDKMMPTVVALTENGAIVGKRAEVRSAKRCQDVLCAYRQMLYGMEENWRAHRKGCEERWQFAVSHGEDGEQGADTFFLRGERVPVGRLIEEVMRVVCYQLMEASKPGGTLQLDASQKAVWCSVAIGVPECFSDAQRNVVDKAASSVVSELLGASTQVFLVHETLAAAMQFVSLPPFQARTFMVVDFGAAHLTASLYDFLEGGEGMALREMASCTNVFVGGDEMVHR